MSAGGDSAEPLVRVEDVHTYYGKSHILHGVSLKVGAGEVVGLLGRNGEYAVAVRRLHGLLRSVKRLARSLRRRLRKCPINAEDSCTNKGHH